MKPIVILLSVILLSSCSLTGGVKQKVSDKILEKTIEKQTGDKVSVDSDNNQMTIKTADGETTIQGGENATIPSELPKELLVSTDAKVTFSSKSPNGIMVTYTTDDEQTVVAERLKTSTKDNGWTMSMETNTTDAKMLVFTKDKQAASVTIGKNSSSEKDGKNTVSIIYSTEK